MAQDSSIPTLSENTSDAPFDITAETTQARIANQGYTYNQAGLTYNQIGVMYGGLYNQNADISPEFVDNSAYLTAPSISGIVDIYTPFVPDPNKGMLIGPGLPFQFLTYS